MSRLKKTGLKKDNCPSVRHEEKVIRRLLGTRDVSFGDYKYWNSLVNKITEAANLYGFNRLDTPLIENFNLYRKSNKLKELYSFASSKTDKIALRPDLTLGLARAYVEQEMDVLPQPVKVFSYGPVLRQETKVQSGCYRQFHQFNLEIFGEEKAIGEALTIFIAYNIFKELQINVQVQINSIGDGECQKEFLNKFLKFYRDKSKRSKLCAECKKQALKNPLALLDCQEKSCLEVKKEAPQITSFLSEASNSYFTRVLEYLDELGVNYNFNPYLIRGLNYYNDTIFEIWSVNDNGEVDSRLPLGSGGRYNQLIERLGGKYTPAVGFAGGIERTVAKLKEKNLLFKKENDIIFIAQVSDTAKVRAIMLFEELYKLGFSVRQSFTVDNLREQLEEAKRLNARIVLILGKKEIGSETIMFRDVEQGLQEVIALKDLKERLHKEFDTNKKNK